MIYQEIRLPCKNDQGYCDPTTRTQLAIVWFLEDTCTTFQVAKNHARMIKFHEKHFIETNPFKKVNPSHKKSTNSRHIHNIENKLTRFQINHEKEFACKYKNPLYEFVEYGEGFDMTTGKIKYYLCATHHPINEDTSYVPVNLIRSAGNPGGNMKSYDSESTRLQELSLMKSIYFGAIC